MIVILTLGGVIFQDFEIPEKISGGGAQSLDTKKFLGGSRIIDALGSDDDEIAWDGRFRGFGAEGRCQQLDLMRKQGVPISLTFSTFSYQVLIKRFKFDFQQPFEIPYSISLEVLVDNNAPPPGILATIDEVFGTDLADSLDLSGEIDIPAITSALNNVQTTVSTIQSLTGANSGVLNTLSQDIVSAQGATQTAIGAASGQITPVAGSVFGGVAGLPPATIAANVAGQASSFASLSNLIPLNSVLGVMNKNLATVGP